MTKYRVGCISWTYKDWTGTLYPPKVPQDQMLPRYSKAFDLVEADATFYRSPKKEQVQAWVDATPPGFTFSSKMPQAALKDPGSADGKSRIKWFLEQMEPLRASGKLGPMVAQFPPWVRYPKALPMIDALLDAVPASEPLAVEMRHESWYVPEFFKKLEDRNVALVWNLIPEGASPFVATADFRYVRLMGDRVLEKFDRIQRDKTEEMRKLVAHLKAEPSPAREVFLLVSNRYMGYAPENAQMLQQMLGLPKADLAKAGDGPRLKQATLG